MLPCPSRPWQVVVANGTLRGHNFVWKPAANPSWLTARHFTVPQLQQILSEHIATVGGHYRGKVLSWDVVNEAVTDDPSSPNILKPMDPWFVLVCRLGVGLAHWDWRAW